MKEVSGGKEGYPDLLGIFIRIGRNFYVSTDMEGHAGVAKAIGAPLGYRDEKPLVDDGGFATREDGCLKFESFTTSCEVAGDKGDARRETYRIAAEIFGQDKIFTI